MAGCLDWVPCPNCKETMCVDIDTKRNTVHEYCKSCGYTYSSEENYPPVEEPDITYYDITCPCNTVLSVEDGCTVVCFNCNRELDDKGLEI